MVVICTSQSPRGVNGEHNKKTTKKCGSISIRSFEQGNDIRTNKTVMDTEGLFTRSDLQPSVGGALAERLTTRYFGLAADEWKRSSYGISLAKKLTSRFTRKTPSRT